VDSHVHRWERATGNTNATLLLLHGTGGDETDLLPLARLVAPGAALLGVRGNVLENGAPRFFRRLAEGVFDLADLEGRTRALGEFVESAAASYGFDQSRLFALGFSNGANIAASLLLSGSEVLAGAALVRAMVPWEPESPPALHGRRVLLSQGTSDPLVSVAVGERLATLLRSAGADVELAWQAAAHGLVPGDVETLQRWFNARLA
jgi:phospholipase/carboxylesterase